MSWIKLFIENLPSDVWTPTTIIITIIGGFVVCNGLFHWIGEVFSHIPEHFADVIIAVTYIPAYCLISIFNLVLSLSKREQIEYPQFLGRTKKNGISITIVRKRTTGMEKRKTKDK